MEDLYCPISGCIFLNPVICSDTHTYERDEITKWFETHDTSPMTNEPVHTKKFRENSFMKSYISEFLAKNQDMKSSQYVDKLQELKYITDEFLSSFHRYRNEDILSLLPKIKNVEYKHTQNKSSLVHYIFEFSSIEIIKEYIKLYPHTLEYEDMWKQRPIHILCHKIHNIELLYLLIDKGVDLEAEDFYKLRPIHFVCKYWKNLHVLCLLIEKRVDLEAEDKHKWRPIHLVCSFWKDESAVLTLLREKIDLQTKTNYNLRPIDLAIDKNIKQILENKMRH